MSTVLDEVIEKLKNEEEDLDFLQFGIKCWINVKHSANDNSLTADECERLVEKRRGVKAEMREVYQQKMELIKVRNALIPVTVQHETESTEKKSEE